MSNPMNIINSGKRSGADRQQLKDLAVPAANLDGYFTHTDFSAKIMVLKNGRMADNHKSMALLSSKSIMPAEESPSSRCCTPQ